MPECWRRIQARQITWAFLPFPRRARNSMGKKTVSIKRRNPALNPEAASLPFRSGMLPGSPESPPEPFDLAPLWH